VYTEPELATAAMTAGTIQIINRVDVDGYTRIEKVVEVVVAKIAARKHYLVR
jgi:hypothetical protein